MTASPLRLQGWRGPGCDDGCLPRSHDPESHERYGYARALTDLRPRVVRTGPLVVDLNARTVAVDRRPVGVTAQRWTLLAHLAERLDRFCPTSDLLAALDGDARTTKHDERRLNMLCYRLRAQLGAAGHLIVSGAKGRPGRRLVYVEPTP